MKRIIVAVKYKFSSTEDDLLAGMDNYVYTWFAFGRIFFFLRNWNGNRLEERIFIPIIDANHYV